MIKKILLAGIFMVAGICHAQESGIKYPYQNPDLSPSQRAEDLLGRLTLE